MTDDKLAVRGDKRPYLSFAICHPSFLDGCRRLEHFFFVKARVFANGSEPAAYAEF